MFVEENGKSKNDIFSSDKEPVRIYEIENDPIEEPLPKSRTSKSIEICHTARHFTTPSRESTKADEDEVN